MSSQSDKAVDDSPLNLEIESIESISSIMEHLEKVLDEVEDSVSKVTKDLTVLEGVSPAEDNEATRTSEDSTKEVKSPHCVDVEEVSELLHDVSCKSSISFSDDGEDLEESNDQYDDDFVDDYESDEDHRIVSALIHDSSEEEEEEGESKSEVGDDDDEGEEGEDVDEDYGMLAGNAGGDNDDDRDSVDSKSPENNTSPANKNKRSGALEEPATESFDEATPSRKPRNFGNAANSRFAKPAFRGRRPPPVQRGERPLIPYPTPPLERRNTRPQNAMVPRRGGGMPLKNPRGEAEDGSSLFISNWGFRSNLIDQNGNFQRATTDLKNYIISYKSKYLYFFDLVNGRYPQYVRTLPNKMEIWRMSFNVYASGFSEYISHLGEIHCFYQMEMVNDELRWVYKDFNFYPNRMRYGFRVNTFDIADVHSRFVKFVCVRDNIIKQFPYVEIHHKVFIGKKFDNNLRNMMSRLKTVKRDLDY